MLGSALRKLAGGTQWTVAGSSVREVIESLADRGESLTERGESRLRDVIYDSEGLHRDLRVLVNGRSIGLLDGLDTPLAEEDTVSVYLFGARGYPGG